MSNHTRRSFSTRDLSRRYNVSLPRIVAVVDRLGLADRVGRNRVVMSEDISRVEDGLRGAGYLTLAGQEAEVG